MFFQGECSLTLGIQSATLFAATADEWYKVVSGWLNASRQSRSCLLSMCISEIHILENKTESKSRIDSNGKEPLRQVHWSVNTVFSLRFSPNAGVHCISPPDLADQFRWLQELPASLRWSPLCLEGRWETLTVVGCPYRKMPILRDIFWCPKCYQSLRDCRNCKQDDATLISNLK